MALSKVSVTVPAGSVTGLLGPQRSGKTTMLNLLTGLASSTSGDATLQGRPVTAHAREGTFRVGAMVDPMGFYPALSGRRNLDLLCVLRGLDREEGARWIEHMELGSVAHEPYRSYSQGTRQRLAIATALLGSPDLIILDEPANALDADGVRLLNRTVQSQAKRGASVLMTTHLLLQAEQLCDRLVLLAAGSCVYQGTMADFTDKYGGLADSESMEDLFLRILGG
jgi:ABC-2 type transport system ATP-binding protein